MQTYAEMQEQIEKLNISQRKALRHIVGVSKLDAITVEKRGWKTIVSCQTLGFKHYVKIGPRGMKLEHSVIDV